MVYMSKPYMYVMAAEKNGNGVGGKSMGMCVSGTVFWDRESLILSNLSGNDSFSFVNCFYCLVSARFFLIG